MTLRAMALSLWVGMAAVADGATYYVDITDGDDANAGTQEAPFKTIAAGLAAATVAGDVVNVATGTYFIAEQLSVTNAITLHGAGRETTVIDAQLSCRAMSIDNANAIVEGFTITRGRHASLNQNGGGVWFGTGGGALSDCAVTACNLRRGAGIGVFLQGGATMLRCIVSGCYFSDAMGNDGIGVYANGGTIDSCLIAGNYVLPGNQRNQSTRGGGVYLASGTLRNTTVVKNDAGYGGGVYVADNAAAQVVDCIVWGNVAYLDGGDARPNWGIAGTKPTLQTNCSPVAVGTGDITDYPLFRDFVNDDFRLLPGSPCLDAASGSSTSATDVAGAARTQGVAMELGAYEIDPTVATLGFSTSAYTGCDSTTITFTATATGCSLDGATIRWAFDGRTLAEADAGDATGLVATNTFGPGRHAVAVYAALADETTLSATLSNLIFVTASELYLDAACATSVAPYTSAATAAKNFADVFALAGDGTTIHVAPGTYPVSTENMLFDAITIIGSAAPTGAVFVTASGASCRYFLLNHAEALLANVTLANARVAMHGGALCLAGAGGTVSNCVVRGNVADSNTSGGAIYMMTPNGRVTRTLISGNGVQNPGGGGGVCMLAGCLDNCLVVSNTTSSGTRYPYGGGIYMSGGQVVNCTIARNEGNQGGGLYRKANAGYVVNTILYGNIEYGTATIGSPDWVSLAGTTIPTEIAFSNVCADVGVGVDPVPTATFPCNETTYALETGSPCIDAGRAIAEAGSLDLAGGARTSGAAIDIGAFEYDSDQVGVGFTVDNDTGLDSLQVVFTGSVSGLNPSNCVFQWDFDGDDVYDATGVCATNVFGIGRHSVSLVVTSGGEDYSYLGANCIVVIPSDIYVSYAGSGTFPYASPATATSNLAEAVAIAIDGVTIHVAEGVYPLADTISLTRAVTIAGEGWNRTVVRGLNVQVFNINNAGALLSGLAITGGRGAIGGGIRIENNGGTVLRCLFTNNVASVNTSGGGAHVSGANARVMCCVFSNNLVTLTNPGNYYLGGGVTVGSGGIVENSLITGNKADCAGGAYVAGGTLRNCTVVGNIATDATGTGRAGGVYATGGSVVNCIIRDNVNLTGEEGTDYNAQDATGTDTLFSNCCVPVAIGTNGVTADPAFLDTAAGDYRYRRTSPCVNAGLPGAWMETATDFFGNPRIDRKLPDIGFFEHPYIPAGTVLILQ